MEAMMPYWTQVRDVLGGIKTMRDAGVEYLPRFKTESPAQYDYRLKMTKMTNVYAESSSTLASKPFQEPIKLQGEPPAALLELQHDIDGRGNNLTVFASQMFKDGINDGVHWVMVDMPVAPDGASLSVREAQERGLRPYWVHINPRNVLDCRTEMIGGKEVLTFFKLLEPTEPRRIRKMERSGDVATWQLLREEMNETTRKTEWVVEASGTFAIGMIPIVAFITGTRDGDSWVIEPPLRDAVDLQVELYQSESGVKHIKNIAAYPMLAANGIKPPKNAAGTVETLAVGPMAILYAEPDGNGNHGNWAYIEPSGESLRFLTQDAKEIEAALRELMRQPLTVNSENLTVITTAVAAGKVKTLVGAWSIFLKDALENLLIVTARWLGVDYDADVFIFQDFEEWLDSKDLTELTAVRARGDISRRTYWKELVRRGLLASDFDADEEERLLLAETPADPLDEEVDNALEDER